ncbi:DEAD-box ATP-dependent RNA helicase FANCM-like isoform X5 [Hibiscus syriacus]|uniref:DEAD-box ATP-dependent RNA helicase FANCM-like isoform X5 n=1 Tax=Hibiscus syriacus TaxID=106335 RepID=UPI0019238540|nr:DEAD-box ATP-dependent RNA helicase FANCM-like isoform X5 [Hibiscus syriacus]
MASNIPLHIIDEDGDGDFQDEFDWEAAVREIDKACDDRNFASSSSSHFAPPPLSHTSKKNTSRQSTLDRFIGKVGPRPPEYNRTVEGYVDAEAEEVSSVRIDAEAAKTWIYPVNVPLRDYQFAITKTALFSNTLVALPTGLGKTLIAAVAIFNYFRWFPEGKIVFAAPSRPLVMQQIEACHNIVGISQEWTIDMTGQICPTKRAIFWKTKRVFFVTPQVLEKDIQSGACLSKYIVCLVIDEAHRALGNYSYCVAVRELMSMPVQLRILALTATPGSKQPTIQQIINNLCISTLEYRDDHDHDVSPYVHNRKIELIEVPLGQDAVEVNNKLLEVIRPYVARLHANGLIQNRDYQTLSPVDLLNSRDKFRQAPPLDLPQVKHGEVEAYFAVLITLYHIRKLLSSHGIRPAYEMLEEKLRQGPFSRSMSRNEDIMNAKLLMQRSLSHGAPSPKLSKLLEVLINHFQTRDPQNSRVIIFSNFRGSVRDIMNALESIRDLVKATEFIGQSSGKALKGQSQKVQQAVLEKFRAGGYNVIVATSIGEEGLDIMEVDLVICFDANVSPLRMIQRMGRTGRKHDGRVVVLACQGSELKGYMRKQANSRSINKHMQNGGIHSFSFHPSPRMIPHIFKPEVQFVELSIDQFVPRGKKLKDDHAIETPHFREKLTAEETDLIAKYFHPTSESTWRPSLIAFPSFQAFPSKVCKVVHSYRTEMLIDSMQHLQGLTFPGGNENFFVENEVSSVDCSVAGIVEQNDSYSKDFLVVDDFPAANSQLGVIDSPEPHLRTLRTKENHDRPDSGCRSPKSHLCLFGSDFVSVSALGKVLIVSVPSLCSEDVTHSKRANTITEELQNTCKQDINCVKTSDEIMQTEAVLNIANQKKSLEDDTLSTPGFCESDSEKEKMLNGVEKIPETPDGTCEMADEANIDIRDTELSPRLTNFIETGVVPESPITDRGLVKLLEQETRNESFIPDKASPPKWHTEMLLRSSSPMKNDKCNLESSPYGSKVPVMKDEMMSLLRITPVSPLVEMKSPLANLTNSSGSKSWHLSSGEKTETVEHARVFKRLRKVVDCGKDRSSKSLKESSCVSPANCAISSSRANPIQAKSGRGKKKPGNDVRTFIDEEAEVSTEAEISLEEEDDESDSYDDSFIDDRINPTADSTQIESAGRVDMIAIYRRSLLSQSPMVRQQTPAFSPDCVASTSKDHGSGHPSYETLYSIQAPQPESANQLATKNTEERISFMSMPSRTYDSAIENESQQSRKRKLSFFPLESIPAINLEQKFKSEAGGKELSRSSQQPQVNNVTGNDSDIDDDDQFYASLDLDAVEAQATMLLKNKSEAPLEKQVINAQPNPNLQNGGVQAPPSFDLGIW